MESLAICKTCLGAKLWVMHRLPVAANLAVHNFSPQAGVRIYGTTADMLEVFPYMATLTIGGRGGKGLAGELLPAALLVPGNDNINNHNINNHNHQNARKQTNQTECMYRGNTLTF